MLKTDLYSAIKSELSGSQVETAFSYMSNNDNNNNKKDRFNVL